MVGDAESKTIDLLELEEEGWVIQLGLVAWAAAANECPIEGALVLTADPPLVRADSPEDEVVAATVLGLEPTLDPKTADCEPAIEIEFEPFPTPGRRDFELSIGASAVGVDCSRLLFFSVWITEESVTIEDVSVFSEGLPGDAARKVFRIANQTGTERTIEFSLLSEQTSTNNGSGEGDHFPIEICGDGIPKGSPFDLESPELTGSVVVPANDVAEVCFTTESFPACHSGSNCQFRLVGTDVTDPANPIEVGASATHTVVNEDDEGCGFLPCIDGTVCLQPDLEISGGVVESTQTLPPLMVMDLDVFVAVTHPSRGDLTIELTSPGGTSVELLLAGDDSEADLRVTFDDDGAFFDRTRLNDDTRLQGQLGVLAVFYGEDGGGDWELSVEDVTPTADDGALDEWCLSFGCPPDFVPACEEGIFCEDAGLPVPNDDVLAPATVGEIFVQYDDRRTIQDVNVQVDIVHPNRGELQLVLVSPDGTQVQLVVPDDQDNGQDIFVVFDDDGLPFDRELLNKSVGMQAQDFLQQYAGELANGIWHLEVLDVNFDFGDGELIGWCLEFLCPPCPRDGEVVCSSPLTDFEVAAVDAIDFGNLSIVDVDVTLDITHTFRGELLVEIGSAQGTVVGLVAPNDFDGGEDILTTFDQQSLFGYRPSDLAAGRSMRPSGIGRLCDLEGENAKGLWFISVFDTSAGSEDGTLNEWCVDLSCDKPNKFIRGDANGDGSYFPIVDALYILENGFIGGPPPPCMDAADADGDNAYFPIVDSLYILVNGFTGGPPPPPPHDCCGFDPEGDADGLTCEEGPELCDVPGN